MPIHRNATAQPAKSRDPCIAVLDAAAAIIEESGYGALTIEAVAKRSGTARTAIYRRWPNRAALFIELYNRHGAALSPVEGVASARAELIAEISRNRRFWRDSAIGRALPALIAEAQAEPVTTTQFRDRFLPQHRTSIRTILERAAARAATAPARDLDTAADLLVGFALCRLIAGDVSDAPQELGQAVDLVLRGLSTQKPAAAPRAEGGETDETDETGEPRSDAG